MPPEPMRSLWRHPDFMWLWFGQTVSQLGSQVTLLELHGCDSCPRRA